MTEILKIQTPDELERLTGKEEVTEFLYEHLDEFRDEKSAIRKAIEYIFSGGSISRGFILLVIDNTGIAGCLVMNRTEMEEYIPPHTLVYLAVHRDKRGKGLGKMLVERAIREAGTSIALHVEPDNPAIKLYRRLGFSSKYIEMRLQLPAT